MYVPSEMVITARSSTRLKAQAEPVYFLRAGELRQLAGTRIERGESV